MLKRSFKDVLRENLFWAITLPLVAVAVTVFRFVILSSEYPVAEKNIGESFTTACFKGKLAFSCKPTGNERFCSQKFKKLLESVCLGLASLPIAPLDKLAIDIKQYGDKCSDDVCMPHFFRKNQLINGRGMGNIYLPKSFWADDELLKLVLLHEITHALNSKYFMQGRLSRIVGEFFSVYAQILFYDGKIHRTCNDESWNQSALATHGGDYVFPPKNNHRAMNLISSCRYGQLEHIARLLHEKSPLLFAKLWKKLAEGKSGQLGPAWLLRSIGDIDAGAGAIASRFYIFKESDSLPQIAVVESANEYCAFVYKIISGHEEQYDLRAGFQMEWMRGKKHMGWMAISSVPHICHPGPLAPGDILHVRATGLGNSFYRILVVPKNSE